MRNRWLVFLVLSLLTLSSLAATQQAPGSIRGYVFLDKNQNGVFDAGEGGVPGVWVTISFGNYQHTYFTGDGDPSPSAGNAPGPGSYGPTPLDAGQWMVTLHVPDGYRSTTQSQLTVTVPDSGAATGADFGIFGSGPIVYASGTGVAMGGAAGAYLPQTGTLAQTSPIHLIALIVAVLGLLVLMGTPWCTVQVKRVYRRWW